RLAAHECHLGTVAVAISLDDPEAVVLIDGHIAGDRGFEEDGNEARVGFFEDRRHQFPEQPSATSFGRYADGPEEHIWTLGQTLVRLAFPGETPDGSRQAATPEVAEIGQLIADAVGLAAGFLP